MSATPSFTLGQRVRRVQTGRDGQITGICSRLRYPKTYLFEVVTIQGEVAEDWVTAAELQTLPDEAQAGG